MKLYTIKKECHSSGIRFRPCFFKKQMDFCVKFFYNCKYDLDNIDQLDINKLAGYSYGLHHINSARIGWRYDIAKDKIELFGYVYNQGKRTTKHILFVDINKLHNCQIKTEKDHYLFNVNNDTQNHTIIIPRTNKLMWFGYKLFPYFGGNRKAPHQMYIMLSTV